MDRIFDGKINKGGKFCTGEAFPSIFGNFGSLSSRLKAGIWEEMI